MLGEIVTWGLSVASLTLNVTWAIRLYLERRERRRKFHKWIEDLQKKRDESWRRYREAHNERLKFLQERDEKLKAEKMRGNKC